MSGAVSLKYRQTQKLQARPGYSVAFFMVFFSFHLAAVIRIIIIPTKLW